MRGSFAICFIIFTSQVNAQEMGSNFTGRTNNKLTMLYNGLGEDRLGGAKAGYIDSGILVHVIDSTKDLYQVKLSTAHKTYINKTDIDRDVQTKIKPFYLTSSWSIKGVEKMDLINISLDEKLPYKSWMEVKPSKIIIDIYGIQNNSNWISQLKSTKEITDVYINQIEDDVVRITIELKHKQHWGYSINYTGKSLAVMVRHQPEALRIKKLLIAVDAGHGGTNEGAKGVSSNSLEKNYTLRFANELQKLLSKKHIQVIMTRTNDSTVNNSDRVMMLQNSLPDLVVSLHLNSSTNNKVKGVSTYYKHVGYRPLNEAILYRMLQLNMHEFGNVGNFNALMSAPTDYPNSLLEIGFITNAEDEKRMMNPRFQKQTARKIYLGIKDWLRMAKQ